MNRSREFDLLYKRLNDGMQQRLLDEPDLSRRALAYTLPQQLAGIRDVLSRACSGRCSASRNFPSNPCCAVCTSPLAPRRARRLIVSSVRCSGRSALLPVRAAEVGAGTGKSYFLQDLLQKVIFKEHFIAGRNMAMERRMRWLRWAGIAACGIAFLWANIGWWMSYGNNSDYIAEVNTKTDALRETVAGISPAPSEDAPALFAALNQARDAAHSSKFDFDNPPWRYRYGLFQGPKLDTAAQTVYQRLLEDSLMPRIAARVHSRLRAAAANKTEASYEALKAYLMMCTTAAASRMSLSKTMLAAIGWRVCHRMSRMNRASVAQPSGRAVAHWRLQISIPARCRTGSAGSRHAAATGAGKASLQLHQVATDRHLTCLSSRVIRAAGTVRLPCSSAAATNRSAVPAFLASSPSGVTTSTS